MPPGPSHRPPGLGWLVRRLPPRAIGAASHLQAFVLSGVVTVLAVRAYLQATDYPQLGGGGLHIAHVLWGGLLLGVGLGIPLVFLGDGSRTAGAVVGGIGFGLFIDEVGKFVTARTDYFYAPAAAIIYVAFALLVLLVQAVRGRTGRSRLTPPERTANALDVVLSALPGGLTDRRRAAVLRLVQGTGLRPQRVPLAPADQPPLEPEHPVGAYPGRWRHHQEVAGLHLVHQGRQGHPRLTRQRHRNIVGRRRTHRVRRLPSCPPARAGRPR